MKKPQTEDAAKRLKFVDLFVLSTTNHSLGADQKFHSTDISV